MYLSLFFIPFTIYVTEVIHEPLDPKLGVGQPGSVGVLGPDRVHRVFVAAPAAIVGERRRIVAVQSKLILVILLRVYLPRKHA